MALYIDERGHLLLHGGVDPAAAALAESLHRGAWFSIEDLDTAVTSKTGGRQDCKLGALTFNSAYSIGLDMLTWHLRNAGVAFSVKVPDGHEHVVDFTVVDDDAREVGRGD